MDIDYLKEFSVLAETKNYWEASYRLFLNQSTLSKHIKSLESELGVPLFNRTTRKVALTEYGMALLPYAQSITKLQFEYSARLLQMQNQQKGRITIGSLPAMAQYGITDVLLEFGKACPDNSVKIIEDDPKILMKLLFEKSCDLIFLRETMSSFKKVVSQDSVIQRIPYISDYLVAVLPNQHPLASQSSLTLRDLKQEKFAFIKENSLMYDLCCLACQEADFIPNIVFDSHRLDSILDMVTKGGCVALLMNRHVRYPLDSVFSIAPPFTAVKITPAISTQISLCYLKEEPLSPAAQQFIEFFKECISSRDTPTT